MKNFIFKKVLKDSKKVFINTRFAPEPSGYLHIGHLKCFLINYKISKIFKGNFHVRIDDSNPELCKEKFEKRIFFNLKFFKKNIVFKKSSDFFFLIYNYVKKLINFNKAYCDSQKKEKFFLRRGNYKNYGKRSPFIFRKKKETMYILKKMKNGNFKLGEHVIRIKTFMKSKNMILRDNVIYRIKRNKKKNYIFPTYDISNSIIDRIQRISHSICTKEFEENSVIYYFYVFLYNKIYNSYFFPRQIEFSRLEIEGENLKKRYIMKIIKEKKIKYNSFLLYTLDGLINKGYDKKTLMEFVEKTGFTKKRCKINKLFLKKIFIRNNKDLKKIFLIKIPFKIFLKNKIYIENKIKNFKKKKINFIKKKKKIILYFTKGLKIKKFYYYFDKKLKINSKVIFLNIGIFKLFSISLKYNKFICIETFKNAKNKPSSV
ncbi:glutamate--tRNA ligase family protein [Candidatus Vidania fulgoroideorum]